jgi:hypothetical protein
MTITSQHCDDSYLLGVLTATDCFSTSTELTVPVLDIPTLDIGIAGFAFFVSAWFVIFILRKK